MIVSGALAPAFASSNDARAAFAQGELDRALTLLEGEPAGAATLLRVRIHLLQRDMEAALAATAGEAPVEGLSEWLTAKGEIAFQQGALPESEEHFRRAIGEDGSHARAHLGYGRALETRFERRTARVHFRRAYLLDREDSEIASAMARSSGLREEQLRFFEEALAHSKPLGSDRVEALRARVELLQALGDRGRCSVESPREAEVPVRTARPRAGLEVPVVELEVSGRSGRALFDTGSPSFLLLSRSFARRLRGEGLEVVSEGVLTGATGARDRSRYALVDRVELGALDFRDCVVEVASTELGVDALLGIGAFNSFVVTVGRKTLRFERHEDDQPIWSRNRAPRPEDAYEAWRIGAKLYVAAELRGPRGRREGLLAVDTGAAATVLAEDAAELVAPIVRTRERVQDAFGAAEAKSARGVLLRALGGESTLRRVAVTDLSAIDWWVGIHSLGILGRDDLEGTLEIDLRDGYVRLEASP